MPRSTDAAASSTNTATTSTAPAVRRETSWTDLPSAKGALGKTPIELGNTNPERLHVTGNLRHVVAAKEEVIRLRNLKRAAEGAKRPRTSTTEGENSSSIGRGGGGGAAPKASLVKGRAGGVAAGGRPAPQKGRRAEL